MIKAVFLMPLLIPTLMPDKDFKRHHLSRPAGAKSQTSNYFKTKY